MRLRHRRSGPPHARCVLPKLMAISRAPASWACTTSRGTRHTTVRYAIKAVGCEPNWPATSAAAYPVVSAGYQMLWSPLVVARPDRFCPPRMRLRGAGRRDLRRRQGLTRIRGCAVPSPRLRRVDQTVREAVRSDRADARRLSAGPPRRPNSPAADRTRRRAGDHRGPQKGRSVVRSLRKVGIGFSRVEGDGATLAFCHSLVYSAWWHGCTSG